MRAFSIVRSRCGAVAALTAFVVSIASNSASAQGVYEGFTEPRQDILVAATEIGRLDQVFVKVGDTVHSGQPIARLEDSLQSSAVEIAKFQTTMKGELEAATAEADRSEFRTKQFRQLSADEMARPDELLRAETELRVATARVSSMQEQPQLRKLELRRAELQLLR
ncbi:MAG: hypothetical protein AB8B91_16910, partial [Rubripirellula sp.]